MSDTSEGGEEEDVMSDKRQVRKRALARSEKGPRTAMRYAAVIYCQVISLSLDLGIVPLGPQPCWIVPLCTTENATWLQGPNPLLG